jgi:hypothetical protein
LQTTKLCSCIGFSLGHFYLLHCYKMGFLKKLFKKKKKTSDGKSPAKNEKRQEGVKGARANGRIHDARLGETRASGSSHPVTSSLSSSERKKESEIEPGRIVPRNRNHDGLSQTEKARMRSRSASASNENYINSNAASNGLSYQQLQQLERQQNGTQPTAHQPMFQMSAEIPRQQMLAMDDMNRSYASSSSFNVSTDAEDSEYENLRTRGVLPGTITNSSALDMSMSAASNPTSYTGTDHDTVFPALDDLTMPSMTTASKEQSHFSVLDPALSQQEEMARKLGMMPPPPPPPRRAPRAPSPEEEPGYIPSPTKKNRYSGEWAISPSTEASNDPTSIKGVDSDPSSWALSPSTEASNDPRSTRSSTSNQYFSFEEQPSTMNRSRSTPKAYTSSTSPPNSTKSRNTPGAATRNFASPHSHASSNTGGSGNEIADFADFGNFKGWDEDKADMKPAASARGEFDRAFDSRQPSPSSSQQASSAVSPPNQQDRSLSELLALAKNKNRKSGTYPTTPGRSRQAPGGTASNSSVNSAPAYSSSYLRQFHNLGKYNKSGYNRDSTRPTSPRMSNDETSISDIIESLETSNRMRKGSGNIHSSGSVGDMGSSSITRLARERLREKRRKDHEQNIGIRSSDESANSEESESWLFDGVTGALGPRGIAADLESLSGRSNRSKNSQGNKSNRSPHSKSQQSSSRKPRTSNESVGSRESRHSRGSRTSRYSHRSTKSYISQMSEQSRSVANDLLRLEMQLAMVGQENRDDLPARSINSAAGGAGSMTGSSRNRSTRKPYSAAHRSTSSSASKRSKVTVIAPPGKLGIILANKADAKGTVVSGVRTSSALVDKVSPGDRIIGIDGEDVGRMTVSEITVIMSRKADYERSLTILTIPKYSGRNEASRGQSSVKANDDHHHHHHQPSFDNNYQPYRR